MKRSFVAWMALGIALVTGGVLAQGSYYNYPIQEGQAPTPLPTAVPLATATQWPFAPGFTPAPSLLRTMKKGKGKKKQLTPTPVPVKAGPSGGVYQGTFNPKK